MQTLAASDGREGPLEITRKQQYTTTMKPYFVQICPQSIFVNF